MSDPTTRFSDRVRDYVRYRPSYPRALMDFMARELGLGPSSVVADIGSGTGIFTRQLLEAGATVFAVEPNREMREAAEEMLRGEARLTSIAASAEATGLPAESVDLITAAQAFHWFDAERARVEWQRILRPDGSVALIWNERKESGSAFLEAYENLLLTYGTDYQAVKELDPWENGVIDRFLANPRVFVCENEQLFDFDGLKGRLLSSSYVPAAGDPKRDPMLDALAQVFADHNRGGNVRFEYRTRAYYGRLA